jgi:hypothetical protein
MEPSVDFHHPDSGCVGPLSHLCDYSGDSTVHYGDQGRWIKLLTVRAAHGHSQSARSRGC